MPVTSTNVTVVGTAGGTRIAQGKGTPGDPTPVTIYNPGTAPVYIGGSGVTTANGVPLAAAAAANFALVDGDDLYGIIATATTTVSVMRGRV